MRNLIRNQKSGITAQIAVKGKEGREEREEGKDNGRHISVEMWFFIKFCMEFYKMMENKTTITIVILEKNRKQKTENKA